MSDTVIIAMITVLGTVATAAINNWNKLFPRKKARAGVKSKPFRYGPTLVFAVVGIAATLGAQLIQMNQVTTSASTDHVGKPDGVPASDPARWMQSGEYEREFTTQRDRGYYPSRVEGRSHDGVEEFRAEWKPAPPGNWESYHWMTETEYEQKNRDLLSRGFSLTSVMTFRDTSGTTRHLATWTQRR